MLIIKPDSMPPLWWLFPWSYARQLYRNAQALKALCDRQDDLIRGKKQTRQRWSIVSAPVSGPGRKYMFIDNDTNEKEWTRRGDESLGKAFHYDGPNKAFTVMNTAEAAIDFCDYLNNEEPK
jgi:hypothetical protein